MIWRSFTLLCSIALVAGCETIPNPSPIRGPYVRAKNSNSGFQFTGAFFTPGGDVELSVLGAPVACDSSVCASTKWQSLGNVKAGAVGGAWPFEAGKFLIDLDRSELDRRRGMEAPCRGGPSWGVTFAARDLATGKFVFGDGADFPQAYGFFSGLPRCR